MSDEATKKREPEADGDEGEEEKGKDKEKPSRLGKFIQTYHGFLSTFVIGAAGLIATSIWQYKQSEIATPQAESQQKIAETQAENSWRIERAEILSKNLQVLAAHGPAPPSTSATACCSRSTRGNILDPELAVSYALELGKDNPERHEVACSQSTADKSYGQLAQRVRAHCDAAVRHHARRAVCARTTSYAERSAAIAQLDRRRDAGGVAAGRARAARSAQGRAAGAETSRRGSPWLFEPSLIDLYERRQWDEIERFQKHSTGAHVIASLVLAAARTRAIRHQRRGDALEKFHADQRSGSPPI